MAMPNLTFGIELEFLCLRPKDVFGNVGEAIYDTLIENDIPATGHEDIEEDVIELVPSHTRWRVETDILGLSATEKVYLPEGWEAEAVELSSRKFHFFDDWRGEVAKVLKILRELEECGCRFITNRSTGFHGHVGNDTQRVPLRTAKNVFQLVTAFERCFDELHSVPRIDIPKRIVYNHYYYPPSFFHAYTDRDRGPTDSLFDRLANIDGVLSYEQLGLFFSIYRPDVGLNVLTTGHNSAYNFDNLFADEEMERYEETLTGTIEFRQHTRTLAYIEIIAWVLLTCTVVQFCSRASAEEMIDLCLRAADKRFHLEDLLVALDCPEDVMDHYLNGATIGVITEAAEELPITSELVKSLIEQNDTECEDRADRTAVRAVIDQKYHSGLYGLDPTVHVEIPPTVAAAELRKAMVTVYMAGMDVHTEEGISRARSQVFRDVARLYQKGDTGRQLPLQSYMIEEH